MKASRELGKAEPRPEKSDRCGHRRNFASRRRAIFLAGIFMVVGATLAVVVATRQKPPVSHPGSWRALATNLAMAREPEARQPKTLRELLQLGPEQLEKVDVALMNLLCAEGLRGSEELDIRKSLETLDAWARHVERETKRNQHLFDEHPERFKNSLAYYRMAILATVLVQDLHIQYNPEREKQLENGHTLRSEKEEEQFFGDSRDVFIHGLLGAKPYGTCASLPFIYVAVGRRLGYPVTLATTASHFYVRYEEGEGKHLNVEATEHRAFLTPSDDEYRNPWELHVSEAEIVELGHLRPLSNKEILGHSLLTRSAVLRSMKQYDQQAEAWAKAARYLPDTPMWKRIAQDMEQMAKHQDDQQRRNALWDQVARVYVPPGPGYVYFQDRKVRLHFLMNHSADLAAIEQAVKTFENELGEYTKPFVEPGVVQNAERQGEPKPQLVLRYRAPSGTEVRIPADFLPPLEHGWVPAALSQRVADAKLEDAESILAEFWRFFDELVQSKQRAMLQRMRSGQPVMISEETVPPEYRQSVPLKLEIRLSGLKDAQDIVNEMWAFRREEELRRAQEQQRERAMARQQALDAIWRAGLSPAQAQPRPITGVPTAFPIVPPSRDRRDEVPEIYREWITPEVAGRLSPGALWLLQQNEKNRRILKESQEMRRQTEEANRLPRLPSYQVVPASLAARNSAVERPAAPISPPTLPLTVQPFHQRPSRDSKPLNP
jgi:hypothetical protein